MAVRCCISTSRRASPYGQWNTAATRLCAAIGTSGRIPITSTATVLSTGMPIPDKSMTHIVGHWNYEEYCRDRNNGNMDFKKTVYVVSDAPVVRLFVNGKETGRHSFL